MTPASSITNPASAAPPAATPVSAKTGAERVSGVKASAGFASETGPRERNEDFGGVVFGSELPQPRRDVVAAIADGIGGAKGGRIAAETAVRGFLDGFCDLPETMEVRRASARVLNSLNRWIYSEGHRNAEFAGMGCTFTALVLRGRIAHLVHVGDTRAYRLRGERLACLTTDHVREEPGGGRSNILTRALGVETEVRLDYAAHPVALHDRYLLCTDGVHGSLTAETIAEILRERSGSEDSARALVKAALDAGSTDNCTALVLDVVDLPTAGSADIGAEIMRPAAPPGADRRRDGRRLRAESADVGRPLHPPVRCYRRSRRRRGGVEVSQAAGGGRRDLPRGIRPRVLGRRARAQSLCRPHHRAAAGTADLSVHGDAALSGRTSGNTARAPAGDRSGGRPQYRDQTGARRGGAASRRHHPSRHQAGQCDPGARRLAQADRSRRGARARARGFPGRRHSRNAGLHGARNVQRRAR